MTLLISGFGAAVAPVAWAAAVAAVGAPGSFVAVPLARIIDTRAGSGTPKVPIPAAGTLVVQVGGRAGVPATGVSAVTLSITAVNPPVAGWLTAFAAGTTKPATASVNWAANRSAIATATVAVSASGQVSLNNASSRAVDVVVDVEGYYVSGTPAAAGAYVPVTPSRSLDTRNGTGASRASFAISGDSATTLTWQIAGRNGVPATGAVAVVMSVTVPSTSGAGRLAVFDDQQLNPAIEFNGFFTAPITGMAIDPGVPVTQQFVVGLSTAGKADLTAVGLADFLTLDAIADVVGYYRAGGTAAVGMYQPSPPTRVSTGTLAANGTSTIKVDGPPNSTAVVTVYAENVTDFGSLIALTPGTTRPTQVQVKLGPGRRSTSTVVVKVGAASTFNLFNQSARPVDVTVDQYGYFRGAAAVARTVWTSGVNESGELGHGGTGIGSTVPAPVLALTGAKAVTVAASSAYAIKADGTLWAWGKNSNDDNIFQGGQLGDGTSLDRSLPVKVLNVSNVVQVVADYQSAYARQADGTVWAWGEGVTGPSGDPTDPRTARAPVKVAGLTNIVSITVAPDSKLVAVKADGTVLTRADTPGRAVQPTALTGIKAADGGAFLRIDGRVQVGTSIKPGLTGIVAISDGVGGPRYAVKSDGTLWTFANQRVTGITGTVTKVGGQIPQFAVTSDGALWQLNGTTATRVRNVPPVAEVSPSTGGGYAFVAS